MHSSVETAFAVTDKGVLDHLHRLFLAAHVDFHTVTDLYARGHTGERDRLIERGRETTTGDFARAQGPTFYLLVAAQHALAFQPQTHELARNTAGLLFFQRFAADKPPVGGFQRHRPG